jgi:MFS family permease
MVALKIASHDFPREQTAMIAGIASGAWSLLNAVLSPIIGRLFDQRLWSEAFWIVALCPIVGVGLWIVLQDRRPRGDVRLA